MSRNIIEISSEDEDANVCTLELGAARVHSVSSSESEIELPSTSKSSSSKSLKKSKYGPESNVEDFPNPSKLAVFQKDSKIKHKTSPKMSTTSSRNHGTNGTLKREKSPKTKCKTTRSFSVDSENEVPNLDTSISSSKSHDISDSNSDASVSLPSPLPKRKKKTIKTSKDLSDKLREKQLKAEEKLEKKKNEEEAKARKKATAESIRKFKPGECLKHLTTRLDAAITKEPYGNDVLSSLDGLDTKYEIISQRLSSTVTWIRDGSSSEEDLLLVIWTGEHFVHLVSEMKVMDEAKKFQNTFPNKRIILVLFGLEFYMKKLMKDKCKKSSSLSASLKSVCNADVEFAMIQMQLVCKCNCKVLETRADIALHVAQVTKSVAEMPFRLERQKLEEQSDWHASSESKDCVKVDRLGNGLGRLWRQQICQFNHVTLDISEAIAQVYKTPTALIKAYEACSSRREGERLLADIVVRRGKGPSASTRTVGKELSKKVYYLFNSTDPDQHLSQVQELV